MLPRERRRFFVCGVGCKVLNINDKSTLPSNRYRPSPATLNTPGVSVLGAVLTMPGP
jgi:hypothetical protein